MGAGTERERSRSRGQGLKREREESKSGGRDCREREESKSVTSPTRVVGVEVGVVPTPVVVEGLRPKTSPARIRSTYELGTGDWE